jgi:hypothetical protein
MSARAGRRGKGRKWIGGTDEGGTKKRMMVEGDEREIREHNPGIKIVQEWNHKEKGDHKIGT